MIVMSFAQIAIVNGNPNPKTIFARALDLPVIVPILVGLACGLVAGLINGGADRLHQDPAVHRHARHDGVGPRRGALVVERQPDLLPDRGAIARASARGMMPVDRLHRARDPLPPDHALHALRQALLRDRLERGRGADVGDQRRAPQGAGLHHRRHAGRGGGDPAHVEEPDRAGGHGRDVRARRHRDGGDRRRVASPAAAARSSAR